MKYEVTVEIIRNEVVLSRIRSFEYQSEISTRYPYENRKLIEEVLEFYKKELENKGISDFQLVLDGIEITCEGIERQYKDNIPENLKEIFEESKKELEEFQKTPEYVIEGLHKDYIWIIDKVKMARRLSEELKILDSQEYLNFLDELNKLSIDQDRE